MKKIIHLLLSPIKYTFLIAIRLYQLCIGPFIGNVCRFYPTCSHYMLGCIQKHGPLKGTWLGCQRLCKCHPFHLGGYDPVPDVIDVIEK